MSIKEMVIKSRLNHDDTFLKLSLLRIYSQQEEDEQATDETRHDNGVGFNKADAYVLTPIARDMVLHAVGSGIPAQNQILTPEAMREVRKRMPKYVNQLITLLTDEEAL